MRPFEADIFDFGFGPPIGCRGPWRDFGRHKFGHHYGHHGFGPKRHGLEPYQGHHGFDRFQECTPVENHREGFERPHGHGPHEHGPHGHGPHGHRPHGHRPHGHGPQRFPGFGHHGPHHGHHGFAGFQECGPFENHGGCQRSRGPGPESGHHRGPHNFHDNCGPQRCGPAENHQDECGRRGPQVNKPSCPCRHRGPRHNSSDEMEDFQHGHRNGPPHRRGPRCFSPCGPGQLSSCQRKGPYDRPSRPCCDWERPCFGERGNVLEPEAGRPGRNRSPGRRGCSKENRPHRSNNKDDNPESGQETVLIQRIVVDKTPRCYSV